MIEKLRKVKRKILFLAIELGKGARIHNGFKSQEYMGIFLQPAAPLLRTNAEPLCQRQELLRVYKSVKSVNSFV